MSFFIPLLSVFVSFVLYSFYRRLTRISVARVPGPESKSFLLGNLSEFFLGQAAEADLKWQAKYGDIIKLKAPFGEDRLLISDPKALQYIYQTSGYNFFKQSERRELSRVVLGRGLTWAEGNVHKRQRKVMLPGFSGPEAKALLPLFLAYASKLTSKWQNIIMSNSEQSSILDIPSWVSRATLDAIGKAAFDYEFGATDNPDSVIGGAFSNLMLDTFSKLSKRDIFTRYLIGCTPNGVREFLVDYMPNRSFQHARATAKLATHVAKSLIDSKTEALLQGKGNRDFMSLLVKANASEDKRTQLTEEEMVAQMRTIILAGHETTANTLSWMFLELSRRPKVQDRLRQEIREMRHTIRSRGDSEFGPADLDAMPYMSAVLKETLRYYPVAYNTYREAVKDDILPLSTPIITTSGEAISELPIPKGLKVISSIAAYNRNKSIFGDDAHVFNPERWMNNTVKKVTSLGVLGNLMTFSGGVRSCIGWKFAVMELQAFLVELVGEFEFSPTPESQKIRREGALIMTPTVEGEAEKGVQLPLRVRIAPREES